MDYCFSSTSYRSRKKRASVGSGRAYCDVWEDYENDEKIHGYSDIRFSMGMAIFDDNRILGVRGEKAYGQ
ncbi:MAG: hypothetical protein U9N83_14135 [Thermodesulfobacteriota bacterium]|nr:hypothetical protein [Thermodesulfobacteriota bacterium]